MARSNKEISSSKSGNAWFPRLMMSPTLLVLLIMTAYPLVFTVFYSFTDYNYLKGSYKIIGLKNYLKLFGNHYFQIAVVNTVKFTILAVLFEMVIGLLIAVFIRSLKRGQKVMRTLLLLPYLLPTVTVALTWKMMLSSNYGIVNQVLSFFHLPVHNWFMETGTAFNNSIAEKDVSMSIALKAKLMLESYGATVLLTRPMDAPRTLEERCETLCAKNPDVFVSIHCDGTDSKEESGTHTFYFRPYSMPLANAIHSCMVNIYRSYIYKPTDINYPRVDKGIKYYPFFVTRMNNCPSVLCETGFMSNAIEGIVLTNDNYQYWMAQGIADGIRNYFASNY